MQSNPYHSVPKLKLMLLKNVTPAGVSAKMGDLIMIKRNYCKRTCALSLTLPLSLYPYHRRPLSLSLSCVCVCVCECVCLYACMHLFMYNVSIFLAGNVLDDKDYLLQRGTYMNKYYVMVCV